MARRGSFIKSEGQMKSGGGELLLESKKKFSKHFMESLNIGAYSGLGGCIKKRQERIVKVFAG